MYGMSRDPLLTATIAAFLSVGVAQAQEAPAPAPDAPAAPAPAGGEAPAAPAEGAAAEGAAPGQVSDASATEAEKALEQDLNLFWGKRREVSVVQRRLVEKDGRFEATPYFGTIPNDDFIVYFPMGLRLGYHFSEQFAVEVSGAYALDKQSDLANFLVTDADGPGLKDVQIQEILKSYYTLNVLWAPFYGKISLLGAKLTHFETYIGLGGGLFLSETTRPENPVPQDKRSAAGSALLGFRWYINEYVNIRTDYRHYFFEKFGGGVSIPAEFSLGAGVMFP